MLRQEDDICMLHLFASYVGASSLQSQCCGIQMSSSCRSICSHDCTVDFCEDRGLSLDVSYHGAGRRNLYSCSSRCSSCRSGGDSFGVTRQGGACTAWCSSAGYCGNGQDYINGGSDCRGCGSLPSSCPYTCKTCR